MLVMARMWWQRTFGIEHVEGNRGFSQWRLDDAVDLVVLTCIDNVEPVLVFQ